MSKQETLSYLTEQQQNIKALGRFITPVHLTLQKIPQSISLDELAEAQQKKIFISNVKNDLNTKGKLVSQSELYENLLKAEIALLEPSSGVVTDSEHFATIANTMKKCGLFSMAKSIELLLAKTKLVRNVSSVITSKKAKAARKFKGEKVTEEELADLNTYKCKLKSWALKKYFENCEYRRNRNEAVRPKRSGEYAANKWLFDMVEADLDLDKFPTSKLSEDLVKGLTPEGNYHGSPEQPDNLLGFQLTTTFFYQCLKSSNPDLT